MRQVVSAAGKAIKAMGDASAVSMQTLVDEVQAAPDARVMNEVGLNDLRTLLSTMLGVLSP